MNDINAYAFNTTLCTATGLTICQYTCQQFGINLRFIKIYNFVVSTPTTTGQLTTIQTSLSTNLSSPPLTTPIYTSIALSTTTSTGKI